MKEGRRKDGREGRRKEGIEEILPLVFSQTELVWLLASVSAAELALFHTGAILSTQGYHLPETATWEHLGGDKCLFRVCRSACVFKKMSLCAQSSCFRQYLHIRPSSPLPTFAVCVHVCPISGRFPHKSTSLYFSVCGLAWMLPGLVQQLVKPFVNRSWTFVVMAFELMSLLFILHCFLLLKLQIHTEKLRLALTAWNTVNHLWAQI